MPRFSGTPEEPTQGGRFGGKLEVATETAAPEMVPSYDAMGTFTGSYEPAPVATNMPYSEQMKNLGRFGEGVAVGTVAAVPGTIGDVESLGRAGLRLAGANVSSETYAPTTEKISKESRSVLNRILGLKPSQAEELGSTFGGVLGGFIGPGAIEKGAAFAGEKLAGRASSKAAEVAKAAEGEGFTVSSAQARAADPAGRNLSETEQMKINQKVSSETGKSTNQVDAKFIESRLDDLGKDYDKIYSNEFQIDENIASEAKKIAQIEGQLGAAGDEGVASIARNISNRWQRAKEAADSEAMSQQMMGIIKGQQTALKRGQQPQGSVGSYVYKTFSPGERIDAVPLTPQLLREYGAGNYTNVRPITAADSPAWAKDVNSLITDLTDKLGLRVRPGVYVGNGSGAYGWAHPNGHIFLSENLLKSPKDAVATALHEFGHMTEFQLFEQAPKEIKQAINDAWNASKKEGVGKTVEQLRPITSEKYGPDHAKMVPSTIRDKEYYLGFKEWFAEQVSRHLTTDVKAVTLADKFFKGIADVWKAIYQKVTGYLPKSDAIDQFMRYNWEGKLIDENSTLRIFQAPETGVVSDVAKESPSAFQGTTEPVFASIKGEDLKRLRTYISSRAANSSDGNVRFQARQVLNQIDKAIEKTNPKLAKRLQETNRKYRATLALQEMNKSGDASIAAGNISPAAIGRMLRAEGSDLSHPLSKVGEYGTTLKMRSATEDAEPQTDAVRSLLSLTGRKLRALTSPLSYPLGRGQRAIQRGMSPIGAVPDVDLLTARKAAVTAATEAGQRSVQKKKKYKQ